MRRSGHPSGRNSDHLLHEASVGVYVPYLRNLSALLDHAEAYARARTIDPAVLLEMRLSPNMYSLRQQVGEANRHVVLSCALLAGCAPPVFGDTAPGIAGPKARIAATIDFAQGLPPEAIDAAADRDVVFTFRSGANRPFTGKSLILTFSVPQFFFHVATAYDILRHAGVDLAKKDFWDHRGRRWARAFSSDSTKTETALGLVTSRGGPCSPEGRPPCG
ncbi:DUF1993 domain-containing protein [Bradyrhizobium sp. Pear77]|uniref:DUF1993 domain-containing protein n=1 Tax=Bradyrhizobium altum TaxID=1571202 RepID=UPI0028A255BB|nr:DUF1993 domain-containing protein [Bradyrhizobium altum]MCC8958460.1 DUF1993 domain-containing protein [Bradyrhizobium altum]